MIIRMPKKPKHLSGTQIITDTRGSGKTTLLIDAVIEYVEYRNENNKPAMVIVASPSSKMANNIWPKILAKAAAKKLNMSIQMGHIIYKSSQADPLTGVRIVMIYGSGNCTVKGFMADALFADDYDLYSDEFKNQLFPMVQITPECILVTQTVEG